MITKDELTNIMCEYWKAYPTLGSNEELAEIILERINVVLPQANVIKSVLPTVKEVREEGIKYSWDCWVDEDYNKDERKYAKKDFIEGAEWMRKQLVGKTVL
jgi:hypothetical protein